jgi:hypothetical protein
LGVPGQYFGVALASVIQTTATAINPTWTATPATNLAAAMLSFQTVSGLAPGSYTFWVMEPMVPTFPSVPVGV